MMTIHDAVQYYKENIDYYWNNENYKWAAVKCFQDNWDIEADDFATMLDSALSQAYNLLSGPMYYPKQMICSFAKERPEEVRGLFRALFDEEKLLTDRVESFRAGCNNLLEDIKKNDPMKEKLKNHYQDLRAICVYLSFQYPDKYFLYKYSMYKDFINAVDISTIISLEFNVKADKRTNYYARFAALCQDVIYEINNDIELVEMQKKLVGSGTTFFEDLQFHLLAQTIIYVFPDSMDKSEYWPSKEEYDPGITTEKWISILNNPDITAENALQMLGMMLDYGKPATCTQLAEKYGKDKNYFSSGAASYAEVVANKTGCKIPPKHDNAKWWPILFVGRDAKKEEKGVYVWKLREELKNALERIELPVIPDGKEKVEVQKTKLTDLNTILYGPPGTGKTYSTVIYAVAIIEEKDVKAVYFEAKENFREVKERYEAYKASGQIEFTTFHQSYGYEEFIEGIRPVLKNEQGEGSARGEVEYTLHSGCFKKFCEKVRRANASESGNDQDLGLNSEPVVWKVSLEGAGDNPTKKECFENNHIRIGWDEYGPEINEKTDYKTGGKDILNAFIKEMRIGDVVVSLYSKTEIDAIGIVTGDVEWDDRYSYYRRVRRVNWLVKNIRENIHRINNGVNLTLSTVYRMKVGIDDVLDIAKKYRPNKENKKNYVFIIDEINRGNISKIFGELITLIEKNKRIGAKEEKRAQLPYSELDFGVPLNVYILGTMNTADRSIALMDTALRRRFSFIELMPDAQVLRERKADKVEANGQVLDVAKMLTIINNRIEYLYDREHTIGHAFFMDLETDRSIDMLASIFENRVIPLLQEYFYDDYSKIQKVLGDDGKQNESDRQYQFIIEAGDKPEDLFYTASDIDIQNTKYEIQKSAFYKIESYKKIGKGL